ncbi:ketopantoate reductase family protein [Pseudomonas migulae]|jgi:2-dehydropantoate 2-reductase|uniref:2-dehydropantoate 2-reductase n=1 Tax=Pseudomonas migulae TaxID=78543 RepID=A0ABY8MMU4_9PSED|nr:ketopantoate reductase family protein [Pseudomonas migulae]WGK88454.1 ketopantoate reductase family protein [Pseudomonas migulae]
MRILIVGAGSTGGFFGAKLASAGRDVTFLVRPQRLSQLEQHGLCVKSPAGDIEIQPQLITSAQIPGPFDIVLLAVKAYALDSALRDMEAAVGPDTVILPLLNGMRHMDVIAKKFGADRLLGCVCKVATSLDEHGHIVQQGTFNDIAYGELDGSDSARIALVHTFMREAGFDATTSKTILRDMWEKWTLLAAMGTINCLMRGSIGDVASVKGGHAFAMRAIDEVVSIVRAVGQEPSEPFLTQAYRLLTLEGSPQTSSMYRDLMAGRGIEADQIIGDLLERANAKGLEAPILALVYTNLLVYQAQSGK